MNDALPQFLDLIAEATAREIRRRAINENAADVLAHDDGDAPENTDRMENPDAIQFYPKRR
jgi:hypothetical protein